MDEDVTSIHITEVLSSLKIMDLLEEYPNLEKITCSPSVYNRTSNKYIEALNQLDIDVVLNGIVDALAQVPSLLCMGEVPQPPEREG